MKRLTILTVIAILVLSTSGCRRGSGCFGLRGSPCGRPTLRVPWRRRPPQQVIYQPVQVPMAAPYTACPTPQANCDPCPPVESCPLPGYTSPAYPTVPEGTVQPYTQGYGTAGQMLPGGVIDGGVINGGVINGGVIPGGSLGNSAYGNVIGDRVLQPSQTPPGLQTVPLDK